MSKKQEYLVKLSNEALISEMNYSLMMYNMCLAEIARRSFLVMGKTLGMMNKVMHANLQKELHEEKPKGKKGKGKASRKHSSRRV